MCATITKRFENKGYQHFMFISTDTTGCGNMWKATNTSDNRGKRGIYRYTKPVLLWRGKGKMDVFTSGCTCFF